MPISPTAVTSQFSGSRSRRRRGRLRFLTALSRRSQRATGLGLLWPVLVCRRQLYSRLYAFSIDGTAGAPTAINGSPYTAGVLPESVTIDRASKHLYVPSPASSTNLPGGKMNEIFAFNINPSTGVLSPVTGSPFIAASSSDTISAHLAIEPSERFAYLPSTASNVVYAFSIGLSSGALVRRTLRVPFSLSPSSR